MIKGLPNELRQLNEYVIKSGGSLKEFMSSNMSISHNEVFMKHG